jgi:hypothetical protein
VLLGVGWLYVLLLMHQSGIARTSDVLEQSESIADILSGTHTAIFLVDMHGMVHTDEIGMHTVLYSLLRAPRRDSRQPCPALPAHQRLLPRDVTWRRCAYSRNLRHKRESGCRGNRVAAARCGATDVRAVCLVGEGPFLPPEPPGGADRMSGGWHVPPTALIRSR